ncbi:patatin-like phospholipase family protein [Paralimibaculum aggregatum]|uniref:Patatin-like phospholipase family protein n=1 Tax=Paralimibaculum aggregatum TaxID=3036245 RepID=A0ABQ6LGA3_9RHOB|nr:patatin-like phospholipase family protein [Limibaculum sp. NKW23]GMG81054.1 patatin-like phospholipase family protein [Limibaculum sp. NKW23]
MGRKPRHVKTVNLALQGGGAHGAFTWGVLDRLFEDDRIWVEAISGTSAGAMNAVVAAQGMTEGGAEGARSRLAEFWEAISEAGQASPLKRSPFDVVFGNWSLDNSPAYLFFDLLNRLASPYDLNPLGLNPLREVVERQVDFDRVRACNKMGVFLSATNVETGRARVFHRHEISIDVVMASACLPFMFHAVKIGEEHYWDGGYVGNPVLFPFVEHSPACDIVIVQINPMYREGVPKSARDILSRVNEITFNSSLMKELRAFHLMNELLERHEIPAENRRQMRLHMIEARKRMRPLGASSKLNTEWNFLLHLFEIGRGAAERWLAAHFDDIGMRSTLDIPAMFGRPTDPTNLPDGSLADHAAAGLGSDDGDRGGDGDGAAVAGGTVVPLKRD